MEKNIILDQTSVTYQLKRRLGSRRLRLKVSATGEVTVSAPPRLPQEVIEKFLTEQSKWLTAKLNDLKHRPAPYLLKNKHQDYLAFKEPARKLVEARLKFFNQHYHLAWQKISIRQQQTRWGSCSRRGNLNFNYQIINLPPVLADYIIVHELCHLAQFNHSKAFWSLVAETLPDYQDRKLALRRGQI
jgi:hypothetical protein